MFSIIKSWLRRVLLESLVRDFAEELSAATGRPVEPLSLPSDAQAIPGPEVPTEAGVRPRRRP